MGDETRAEEAAGGGVALLEDDILVPPSNEPGTRTLRRDNVEARMMVAAMQARAQGGNALVATVPAAPGSPFPADSAARPVNDTVYDAVLDGTLVSDGRIGLTAVRAADKGVDLIVQGSGESVAGPLGPGSTGPRWEKPVDLGRPDDVDFKLLRIGVDGQGRVAVFGVSQTGEVWWRHKNAPRMVEVEVTVTPPGTREPITLTVPELRPADPPFGDWKKLEGAAVSHLALTNNADGRIILLAITETGAGSDLVFNEARGTQTGAPEAWYGWQPVARDGLIPFAELAVAPDASGAVNVFVLDAENEISHVRQKVAGSREWCAYTHPGLTLAGLEQVATGIDANGNVAVAAVTGEGVVWTTQQRVAATGVWSGWQPTARAVAASALEFEFDGRERLALFGLTSPQAESGTVWMITQAAHDSVEWSARCSSLLTGVTAMTVVRDLSLADM